MNNDLLGPNESLAPPNMRAKLRGLTAAFVVILALAVVLAVTAIAYLALSANQRSEQNGDLLKEIDRVNSRLVDCSEPEGKCFKEGQRTVAKAVATINDVAVVAAACADQPRQQTAAQISDCIIKELAYLNRNPKG